MLSFALLALAAVPLGLALLGSLSRWDALALLVAVRSLTDVGAGSAVGSLLPSSALAAGLGGAAVLVALFGRRDGESPARNMLAVTAGAVFFSTPAISQFGWSGLWLGDAVRLLSVALLFATVVTWRHDHRLDLRRFYLLSCTPSVALAAVGALAGGTWALNPSGRLSATFSHPNAAGAFLAVATFLALALWLEDRSRVVMLVGLTALGGLLATQSLGAVLGCGMGVAVLWIMRQDLTRSTRLLLLALSCAVALAGLTQTSVFSRISEFQNISIDESLATGTSSDSLSWRILNWSELMEYWQQSPLWGNGLGTTSIIQPLGTLPHSLPVEVLVETGALGLAGLTVFIIFWARLGAKAAKAGSPQAPLLLGLIAFVVVNGSESNLIRYTAAEFLIVSFAAIAAHAVRQHLITQNNLGAREHV